MIKAKEVTIHVPKNGKYDPGIQVKKAQNEKVADTAEKIVKNII